MYIFARIGSKFVYMDEVEKGTTFGIGEETARERESVERMCACVYVRWWVSERETERKFVC